MWVIHVSQVILSSHTRSYMSMNASHLLFKMLWLARIFVINIMCIKLTCLDTRLFAGIDWEILFYFILFSIRGLSVKFINRLIETSFNKINVLITFPIAYFYIIVWNFTRKYGIITWNITARSKEVRRPGATKNCLIFSL